MNHFDLCRKSLHARLGIDALKRRDLTRMNGEIQGMIEALKHIMELARPRLIMGGIRYGSEWEHEPLMKYMQAKFNSYLATGNFEMLIDLVNFCAIESVLRTHPDWHFEGEDR